MWFMVCRWPQSQEGDWARPICASYHDMLWPVQKRFIRNHVWWGRSSKPGCRIVGSVTIVDHRSRQLVLSPLRNCIHRKCTEYRAVSCVFSRAARHTSTWDISWRKNRTSDDIVNAVHKAAAAKRSLATSSVATSLSICVFSRAARRTSTWAISWRKSRTSRRRHSTTSMRGSTATRATQTSVRWTTIALIPDAHQFTHGYTHGSVAEWLACWTQAQKGPGSNRSRDAVG